MVKFMRVSSDKNSFLLCSNFHVASQRQNMKSAQILPQNVNFAVFLYFLQIIIL